GAQGGIRLADAMRSGIVRATTYQGELHIEGATVALWSGVQTMAWVLTPLFVTLFACALLVGYLQVGPVFSFQSLKPDLKKLNPAEGFKQKFLKFRPYLELVKTVVKMTIAGVVIASVIWGNRADIIRLSSRNALQVSAFASSVI